MTTVLLVRHGETVWNRERRIQGWAPAELTDRGREQAEALGKALAAEYDVTAVRSSDLRRCRQTVARMPGIDLDADVVFDDRLRERDFGVCQGFTYDEFNDRFPEFSVATASEDALEATPESGESMMDLRRRVVEGWESLVEDASPDDTVLVVTHGGPIYVLLAHLDSRGLTESILDTSQDNCAVNEIRIADDEPAVVRENHTAFL